MTDTQVKLWGVDATLLDEGSSLQPRLPFMQRGERIFAARKADWSWGDGTVQEMSELEAHERGTATPFAAHLSVSSGQIVVVNGQRFSDQCKAVNIEIPPPQAVAANGFMLRMMSVEAFVEFAKNLNLATRRLFDGELRANREITGGARIALELLQNTGAPDVRSIYIRRIAAARLDCEPDTVRRVGKLAQIRLRITAENLTADVDEYLSVVLNDPRVGRNSELSTAEFTREQMKADIRQVVRAEFSTFMKPESAARDELAGSIAMNAIYKRTSTSRSPLHRDESDSLMNLVEVGHA